MQKTKNAAETRRRSCQPLSLCLFFCRKDSHSDEQERKQQETDKNQTLKEPTAQKSVAAAEENHENIPASSQEPSGVEQLSQQERSPSPPPASRPPSPSRYMRRLPPPPGFYLSKEHSYAQLSPLLWRRRYDQAIDCLEKALRQLHAARRRENRLRSTVLRLRDKRLKQALLVPRDGCRKRGSWTPEAERRGDNQEESESDTKSEETDVFQDRCVDQMELGGHFLPDANSWSEEEKGYCFYCGRGQAQAGDQVVRRVSKTEEYAHQDSLTIETSVETSTCGTAKEKRIVRLKRPPGKTSVETSDSDVTNTKILLQTQSLQHVLPAAVSLTDIHEQSLPFLGSQQKPLLSDMCQTAAMVREHHPDQQQQQQQKQQLFWIQDSPEGQIILVPVPAEDDLQSILKMEGVADEAQTILVSEVDLKRRIAENSGGGTVCDGDQQSVMNAASVEMREDVREKLKEHLEGFHLQLSTEFLN
ncbi:THAP domain-containing protein 7 isoform X2 [Larimichthys crocea]|uniref:THAP domain-containing protein 7 isoform X2 n=1 Tax=Larimichthys crocea TaxID=215358 RepID=UPI0009012242|nr:THAP domain-containing protein 7 isoform X2 [Larimichthys crocea]